jgi:hypothetical protein
MAINLYNFSKVYFCHCFRNVQFVITQKLSPFETVIASVVSFSPSLINLKADMI